MLIKHPSSPVLHAAMRCCRCSAVSRFVAAAVDQKAGNELSRDGSAWPAKVRTNLPLGWNMRLRASHGCHCRCYWGCVSSGFCYNGCMSARLPGTRLRQLLLVTLPLQQLRLLQQVVFLEPAAAPLEAMALARKLALSQQLHRHHHHQRCKRLG